MRENFPTFLLFLLLYLESTRLFCIFALKIKCTTRFRCVFD